MNKQQGRPLKILDLQGVYLELMGLMASMGMMIYLIEVEKQMRNMSILLIVLPIGSVTLGYAEDQTAEEKKRFPMRRVSPWSTQPETPTRLVWPEKMR